MRAALSLATLAQEPDASARVDQYRDEFDDDPGTWSPYTYDLLNFLADGVEKANGTATNKLTSALNDVKNWQG